MLGMTFWYKMLSLSERLDNWNDTLEAIYNM